MVTNKYYFYCTGILCHVRPVLQRSGIRQRSNKFDPEHVQQDNIVEKVTKQSKRFSIPYRNDYSQVNMNPWKIDISWYLKIMEF